MKLPGSAQLGLYVFATGRASLQSTYPTIYAKPYSKKGRDLRPFLSVCDYSQIPDFVSTVAGARLFPA